MKSRGLQFLFLFVGAVLLQVLLFDNIRLFGFITPYPYLIFILLLPASLNRTLSVTLGFALGLAVDYFSFTLGLHAAACTLVAFLQPLVQQWLQSTQSQNCEDVPSLAARGFTWSLQYTLLLVLLHHFAIFLLAAPSWEHLGYVVLKITATAVLTTAIILFSEVFLFASPKK